MICKEELFIWFQSLKGSKRIEVMCGLLNMCYPLELRFYGTCLEDLGRRDFYTLRDEEVKANNISEILKIKNTCDAFTRSKLIVILSLLNSSNMVCSKELFKVLTEEIKIDSLLSSGILSDSKIVEEFLLLLTIAQNHPAFTFEQQTSLANQCLYLENYSKGVFSSNKYESSLDDSPTSPVFPPLRCAVPVDGQTYNTHYMHHQTAELQPVQARITNLKVKPPHRKMSIRIRVAWGTNRITDAYKCPTDLAVFHQKLVQLFPAESQVTNQEKCIPAFPHAIASWNKQNPLTESIISSMTEYIQQLNSRLPGYVLECDFVTNFFLSSFHNRSTLTRNNKSVEGTMSDNPPKNPRLRSLTIYNKQFPPPGSLPLKKKLSENGTDIKGSSPFNSPLQSPLSSPYASPVNSEANSRSASPWNQLTNTTFDRNAEFTRNNCIIPPPEIGFLEKFLISEQLHEHWDTLRNYRIEELQSMPTEELESLGILKEAAAKLRKMLDNKSPLNGLTGHYLQKCVTKPEVPQQGSNESSPVCSEYSSPPQSPSPGEACNQSSSLSSGNEETAEKRLPLKLPTESCKVVESLPIPQDPTFKRTEDESTAVKGSRECLTRPSVSVLPFPLPYSSIITQLPPPQNIKPTYLPIPCRTNSTSQHMSSAAVVFDNHFSRVPLPSALNFMAVGPSGQGRSHTVTPERVLPPGSLPISSVSPFPVVTSGCTTLPSATCCITTLRSCNSTVVTNSSASNIRQNQKSSPPLRDIDNLTKPMQAGVETPYATGYILAASTLSCTCYSTTSSARPSPAPSPSMSPGTTAQPTAVPVSLPYLGMPYIFHPSIPFIQAHSGAPANGFVGQPGVPNQGHAFSYALPNGIAIPPELLYPGHTFSLQSPTSQGQVMPPVSQCYGASASTIGLIPHATPIAIKSGYCYNCGKYGHRGPDCKEQNIDDMSKPGKFQLNYNPAPKLHETRD